jgi:hypothetical protein
MLKVFKASQRCVEDGDPADLMNCKVRDFRRYLALATMFHEQFREVGEAVLQVAQETGANLDQPVATMVHAAQMAGNCTARKLVLSRALDRAHGDFPSWFEAQQHWPFDPDNPPSLVSQPEQAGH